MRETFFLYRATTGLRTPSHPSALWTLPGRNDTANNIGQVEFIMCDIGEPASGKKPQDLAVPSRPRFLGRGRPVVLQEHPDRLFDQLLIWDRYSFATHHPGPQREV